MTTLTATQPTAPNTQDTRRAVLAVALVERAGTDAEAHAVACWLDPDAVRDGSALAMLLDGAL